MYGAVATIFTLEVIRVSANLYDQSLAAMEADQASAARETKPIFRLLDRFAERIFPQANIAINRSLDIGPGETGDINIPSEAEWADVCFAALDHEARPNFRDHLIEFARLVAEDPSNVSIIERVVDQLKDRHGVPLAHQEIDKAFEMWSARKYSEAWLHLNQAIQFQTRYYAGKSVIVGYYDLGHHYIQAMLEFIANMHEYFPDADLLSLSIVRNTDSAGQDLGQPDLPYEDDSPLLDGTFRVNAKWPPFGRFIINEDRRLSINGVNSIQERVSLISERLHDRFGDIFKQHGHDPADFNAKALYRLRKRHASGGLSPASDT